MFEVFDNKNLLISYLDNIRSNHSIGFVPTMGALHSGHLSLINQSQKDNKVTVISIFVNPTQFNNSTDLALYPRMLDSDINKIKNSRSENIIIYAPEPEDIYEHNIKSKKYNFDGLEHQMEGAFRTGHFDGVGTIVEKLFRIVRPHNAYFGEKDFQQLQIIKKLVEKYHIPVNIVGCPIFREENGLAMSSRNERLSPETRTQSGIIFEILTELKNNFETMTISQLKTLAKKLLSKNSVFELEYLEIADEERLKPAIRKMKHKNYRAFVAVFADSVRLIDNIKLN